MSGAVNHSLFQFRYRTIVADPPWPHDDGFASSRGPRWGDYGDRASGAKPGTYKTAATQTIARGLPYPSMTIEAICALPIDFVEADARLFLWATSRHLGSAFAVVEAWGFKYVQTVVWRKTGTPTPFGGSVAPNHAEFLLVAKRGSPPLLERWKSSVVDAPANPSVLRHSQKPDVFLDLIEQASPGPYLEMFARRQRLGWDTWGNEALEHVGVNA